MKRRLSVKKPPLFLNCFLVACIIFLAFSYFLPKETTSLCANSISCEKSLELTISNETTGVFGNEKVQVPQVDLTQSLIDTRVFGVATASGEKHIYVDLDTQRLTAYQGETLILETPISSGLWGRTPTGEFQVWHKVRATRMTGGSGRDYYDLPNVEYVMFFYNDQIPQSRGYGFHGAYWHNNFGHAMSHGCINMRNIDAKILYEWADPLSDKYAFNATPDNPGTKITIYKSSEQQ